MPLALLVQRLSGRSQPTRQLQSRILSEAARNFRTSTNTLGQAPRHALSSTSPFSHFGCQAERPQRAHRTHRTLRTRVAFARDMTQVQGPHSYSTDPILPPAAALPIIISGPSGVGKDAVIKRLQDKRPDLHFVVTATSRPMRPGEQEGVDYFFVSKQQFEEWIATDRLLEHAVVYGEYKGIPKEQVEMALRKGSDVILRIDVQGAATMKRLLPEAVSVFLVAESEKELVDRLVARKTEEGDRMQTRIDTAREEMSRMQEFDYVVVNRDGQMEETVERLEGIILVEKMRTSRLLYD